MQAALTGFVPVGLGFGLANNLGWVEAQIWAWVGPFPGLVYGPSFWTRLGPVFAEFRASFGLILILFWADLEAAS